MQNLCVPECPEEVHQLDLASSLYMPISELEVNRTVMQADNP